MSSFFAKFMGKKSKNAKNTPKESAESLSLNKFSLNSIYNSIEDYHPLKRDLISEEFLLKQFQEIFSDEIINLTKLKKLAWNGIPSSKFIFFALNLFLKEFRSVSWQILLNYIPPNKSYQGVILKKKREEYFILKNMYFPNGLKNNEWDESQEKIMKIILADVPRTQPDLKLFHIKEIQEMMIRLLFVWNSRHPASGYVQGINDLTPPFILAFLQEFIEIDLQTLGIPKEKIANEIFDGIEADTYWCLSKILDYILDNYTPSQPGIQKSLAKIKEICKKMDCDLSDHLEKEGVDFFQFAFKWVYCLLIREFPLKLGLLLFDAYISLNNEGFMGFHIYVCAALILKWSKKLKKMKFNEMMLFLQSIPTQSWTESDIRMLLGEAWVYQSIFDETLGHIPLGGDKK